MFQFLRSPKTPSPLFDLSYHLCGVGTWPRIRRIGHPNHIVVDADAENCRKMWTGPAAARGARCLSLDSSWRYVSSMQMETDERRVL
jgi:hypothetical protein